MIVAYEALGRSANRASYCAVQFYEFLGMSLVQKLVFSDSKFDVYMLAYDRPGSVSQGNKISDREGVIELTHNYGTENDPNYKINNGNVEPHRGFGHTCWSSRTPCSPASAFDLTPDLFFLQVSASTTSRPRVSGSRMPDTSSRRS